MSYDLSTALVLGTSQTGLTLQAQLKDKDGENVGSAITTGFTEIGNGHYLWYYDSFPDEFSGVAVFSAGSEIKTIVDINPPISVSVDTIRSAVETIQIENGVNLKEMLSIIGAVLAGKLTGANTQEISIRAVNDYQTVRVTASVDNYGNRNTINLNLP